MNFKFTLIFLYFFSFFSSLTGLHSFEGEIREYDLKAVFIYNFTKYFEWQGLNGEEFFEIDILGESEIVEPLKEISEKKLVYGKKIIIKNIRSPEEIEKPQIIFISKFSNFDISRVLKKLENFKVLTVGEEEGLCLKGIAVNFVIREGNLKFEINEKALKEAGIKPSSQILKLAVSILGSKE